MKQSHWKKKISKNKQNYLRQRRTIEIFRKLKKSKASFNRTIEFMLLLVLVYFFHGPLRNEIQYDRFYVLNQTAK